MSGGRKTGVYSVWPSPGAQHVNVLCEMDTEGGGWTVIQRRQDGSVNFSRTWGEYRDGFGSPRREFWLGNYHIHRLTSRGPCVLRIDLEDWDGRRKHAFYQRFRWAWPQGPVPDHLSASPSPSDLPLWQGGPKWAVHPAQAPNCPVGLPSIEDEANDFRLNVAGFSGTVQDALAWYHDKRGFSTPGSGSLCADLARGGWWYHQCFFSNLNGVYYKGGHYTAQSQGGLGPDGIVWFPWKNTDYYSLKKTTMMIRPRAFRPHFSL
ncbi:angiopoietin-related protein 7-like [Ornithorhynchus anatinus]|uniref:angiopoietin-related protein 7-like n=1 Tax=Ornithorhynchus anatinus TaxID=9258 RepID=UPI0019D4D60A|nr:angiopoietin-related protein 7-like [Ornithorhynchus anatinus]